MSQPSDLPVVESSPGIAPGPKIWSVGTLRYDQKGLIILFFWLMWNDFSITLIEQIGGLNSFLMIDHGAKLAQMAMLGLLGFFLPWLNPWVSTWSDRHRGPWGRRRPFLFVATPFYAFFLGLFPYTPTIYHHVQNNPIVMVIVNHLPDQMNGQVFFMGICGLLASIFNAVVLAIFSYLYWDVVPEALMGRFQAMSKIAALAALQVWLFFIFGMGETHSKSVYVGTAIFSLTVYMVSVWQIKEPEYPPPDSHEKMEQLVPIRLWSLVIDNLVLMKVWAWLAPVRAYFVECFSKPYFLWIFTAMFLYQMGNQGGGPQQFYLKYDLNIPLSGLGWAGGMATTVTSAFGVVCGFAVGALTDKLKPVRVIGPSFLMLGSLAMVMYFFVHDAWSWMVFSSVRGIVTFCQGVAFGAFQIEVFPREKIGQFCSAQAVFYQVIIMILSVPIGLFWDFMHAHYVNGYRVGFDWMAMFYMLAGLCYIKVYINWKNRHGLVPVPHAG